jgi:hypothetical protein
MILRIFLLLFISYCRRAEFSTMVENSVIHMSSSQRKRYRDHERYLQMTQDQREVYLQRSREYKR